MPGARSSTDTLPTDARSSRVTSRPAASHARRTLRSPPSPGTTSSHTPPRRLAGCTDARPPSGPATPEQGSDGGLRSASRDLHVEGRDRLGPRIRQPVGPAGVIGEEQDTLGPGVELPHRGDPGEPVRQELVDGGVLVVGGPRRHPPPRLVQRQVDLRRRPDRRAVHGYPGTPHLHAVRGIPYGHAIHTHAPRLDEGRASAREHQPSLDRARARLTWLPPRRPPPADRPDPPLPLTQPSPDRVRRTGTRRRGTAI
jgi:hypothetical protein